MDNSRDESRHYTIEEIQYLLDLEGLYPGNVTLIAKALVILDKTLVDAIQKQVHFFDGVDANAFHLPLDARCLRGKKCLIFLSQELRKMKSTNEREAIRIILHEIAHFYLRHKSPIEFDPRSSIPEQQEFEADEQVKKWIS